MKISIENIQIMFVQCEENTNKVQLMVILVIKKLLLEYCCWSLVDFQSRFTEILPCTIYLGYCGLSKILFWFHAQVGAENFFNSFAKVSQFVVEFFFSSIFSDNHQNLVSNTEKIKFLVPWTSD